MKTTRFMKGCYDGDGSLLLLNTYTGDLLKFSQNISYEVNDIINSPDATQSSSVKSYLIKKQFIIDDSVNESARAELKYFETAHDTNKLLLTILPTEDCNFRCQYCYEEHNVGKMTQYVIRAYPVIDKMEEMI